MDLALMAVAEELADEFHDLPNSTVIRVLTDCADEFPNDDPHLIGQAARARLEATETRESQVDHD